jgi:hypothetical protein
MIASDVMVDLEADNTNEPLIAPPKSEAPLPMIRRGSSDNVSTEGEIDLRERAIVTSIVATWSLEPKHRFSC